MFNNKIIFLVTLAVAIVVVGVWVSSKKLSDIVSEPTESAEPSVAENSSVTPSKSANVTKVPTPTGDGKITFVGEKVPWELLLSDASCELKGEIKFLNSDTYNNQDALFTYSGVDHPARNVKWTISPAEPNLEVGPNIFSKMPIPNGQSLLGLFKKGDVSLKKYELTAVMEYGRLVDENGKFVTVGGDVKVFKKQCLGKTSVVFP